MIRRAGATGILLAIVLAFGWLPPLNDAVYPPPEASPRVSGPVESNPADRVPDSVPLGGASPSPTLRPSDGATASMEPRVTPSLVESASTPGHSLTGIASWGYFSGHVVTRLPRWTPITVIGPLGSWSGKSWGYGPATWTGRIVDADREVFRLLCGDPSKGLCTVELRY